MQEAASVQRLSKRVAGLKPSGIRKFFDIAATMKDVISLGIGEPDFTTPKPILEAGVRSLQQGETHYTSNSGKLELRPEHRCVGSDERVTLAGDEGLVVGGTLSLDGDAALGPQVYQTHENLARHILGRLPT